MIIKKINIIAFGGIKNKSIELTEGLNIIYGENEAGKSTMQAFIKVWLYGFSNYRGRDYKNNERLKYTPLSGEAISGELYIEYKQKNYVIRRTFGKTKKEDTCYIIDLITGEEATSISKEEPGKSFLGINRGTFINTLFIGQLAVNVKKDKEEEIINRISNMVSKEDGQVSIDTAFSKLDVYKKSISNNRRNGQLDILKEKLSSIFNERYEAYELSNNNLDNEEKLIKLKEEKQSLNNELNNLEIYKKYLKKTKLQKEYEEITEYFRKKQELENKEDNLNKALTFNDEIITERFLKEVKDEYSMYLSLLDMKIEEEDELKEKEERLYILKEPLKKYKYIGELPQNILSILERLKIKNEVLKEKVDINRNIQNELNFLEAKREEGKALIGNAYAVKDIRIRIQEVLELYEEKLKVLRQLVQGDEKNISNNKIFKLSLVTVALISILCGIIIKNKYLSIILYSISLISAIIFTTKYIIMKNQSTSNKKINNMEKEIKILEEELDSFVKKINVSDYRELLKKVKIYDDYLRLESKINSKVEEKNAQVKLLDLDKATAEYKENIYEINRYLNISKVNDLDELIYEVENYTRISSNFKTLELEINNIKNNLEKTLSQLCLREEKIIEKLASIGLSDVNFSELEDNLKELEEKLALREEINKSLLSVEEAYIALTKGKDMDFIKEELKDVINISINYSYKNEEEIDDVLKNKNLKLIEVEKSIKDFENKINNRFIGKRTIPEIEEEIQEIQDKISILEKSLKASSLTTEILNNAYDEIRSGFGPILNKKVISSFKDFTNGRYKDVMVSDKYEIKVLGNNEIMQAEVLSNGANDQLYLALRLAFIEMIFKNKDFPIYLDDTFIQYDDNRAEKTIIHLIREEFKQCIIFTCQKREINIIRKNNIPHKYIKLA